MKLLVCISNVPDTTTKIKFVDNDKRLDETGIQWVLNPWDELSLTRALELKENPANGIESITVAHVGPVTSEPTIRKALAIGADDAIRVNANAGDAFFVANQLAWVIKNNSFDIILCGIESSDFNGSAVGGMLAECLGYPSVSSVSNLNIENGEITLTREIDGGKEVLTVPTPFVAIVQKGIAKDPKIAAMRGIMMARTKPVKIYEPQPFEPLTTLISFEKPKPKAACKYVHSDNAEELIDLLQNEAKLI